MVGLVNKQWDQWMDSSKFVGIPREFQNQEAKPNFILEVSRELTKHLVGSSDLIAQAKKRFADSSLTLENEYMEGKRFPRPGAETHLKLFNLDLYWDTVALELPSLYFLFRILSKCPCTEAAAERFFSSEAVIHSKVRNRLDPDTVRSLMRY